MRTGRRRESACFLARVSIPFASYEPVRSYLTLKVGGSVTPVGSELEKRHGKSGGHFLHACQRCGWFVAKTSIGAGHAGGMRKLYLMLEVNFKRFQLTALRCETANQAN